MAEEKSKEDLLSNLPPELLNAEKVSNDDLIKFAPVLALQQVQAYEKRAVDELDLQNQNTEKAIEQKRGILNFLKMNPLAGIGAAAALFCLGKGLGEFGYRGSYKKQHGWMKGRLFSQAFCIASCVVGHHYYAQKAEQAQLEKKERYEAERDHICRQTGITPEEFELRKVKEAEERQMMKSSNANEELKRQRLMEGDYFTAEQRAELNKAIAEIRSPSRE